MVATKTVSDVNQFCHYATQDELDYLHMAAAGLPGEAVLVMLGAGPGVMALAALEGNSSLNVFVVDKDTCEYFLTHARQCGFSMEQLNTCVGDSVGVGHGWDVGRPIDMLIVDADHSYTGVMRDIAAWFPHLAPGAIVFFHDYDAAGTEFADQEQYYGVMRAVDERIKFMHSFKVVARVGTAIVFQKAVE